MEIILSRQCESLTGSLGKGFGYHIQRRTEHDGTIRFWGVRKSKGAVPPNGHWKFILSCVNLAQSKLYITDIHVERRELADALSEAGLYKLADNVKYINPNHLPDVMNAADILNFKNKHNL